ncbi:MAG: hypothetical protein CM1200mP2_22340 [Planctomycetaceae bacterium]|nr:MAG: hypothetical protein CM1200mP2_22340 [Planctomycetaceae bacterium]
MWKLYFGRGLTAPLDDLGAQGTRPVHPELLDWLAVEFIESGWNVKHMVRLIVNSGAYRQNSLVGASLRERDPYNQLLARQSRFRLDAEIVRDNALWALSGLLVTRVGGPSVKPYQPAGYWRHMNFPAPDLEVLGRQIGLPPGTLHLVAANVPASQPAGLRRPQS